MVGWKRIVVTIGEKIGNEHLNYAQGATSEIIAASTIGLSTGLGFTGKYNACVIKRYSRRYGCIGRERKFKQQYA
jgi:hypothetical protein